MPRNTALGNPTVHPDEDEFNRWSFSRALADRIPGLANSEGAAVIGLYGRWGYGKSSVLNFITYRLKDRHSDRVVLLPFNPWLFHDRESLLIGFYAKLAKELGVALKGTKHKIGEALTDYGGALSAIPWFGGALKSLADSFGKKLADNPIENKRKQISEAMADSPKIVVVLIDDLDRLDRDEIVLVLKLVRLTGDIPNVVYVLSFDDVMIAQAVRSYYGNSQEAGRQFIEKIVQFPFVIPAVSQVRMVEYALNHARSAATNAGLVVRENDWAIFRDLTEKFLVHRLATPRQAIRYGSALDFGLPILKGEVDPVEQMIIEGLRILFPELYAYIRDHDRVFTSSDRGVDLADHARRAMGKDVSKEEMNAAVELLSFLFRRPPDIPQSVSDPRYFQRHFGYALEREEIADAEIESLLSYVETSDRRLSALIQQLAGRNPDRLITLLRNARPSKTVCVELSRVLATNGTFFAKGTPVKEDARATKFAELLADLLWRAKSAGFRERDELAANILSCVEPLALAPAFVESLSTLNSQIRLNRNLSVSISEDEGYARGETEDYDLIISDEGWSVLARAFVPRIRDFLVREDAGMFERGTDSYALFKLWDRYDQGTVKDWIESRIKDDPEFTLRLLRSAKTDISSSSYGAWGYSWVCAVASYPVIREALDKMFGEALSDDNDDRGDVVLARSFLREHQDRLEKKQAEIRQDGSKDVNAESDDGKA